MRLAPLDPIGASERQKARQRSRAFLCGDFFALVLLRTTGKYKEKNVRYLLAAIALLTGFCINAGEAGLAGVWQRQTPHLWQQLELNRDGTYLRSVVTSESRRTEIGRWRSDVSVLVLQPDHVITTRGARVPLPPREKQIDVAGVDANSLTLYYDGNEVEAWQRQQRAGVSPSRPIAAAGPRATATASEHAAPSAASAHRAVTVPVTQVVLSSASLEMPTMPHFLIGARVRALPATFASVSLTSPGIAQPPMPIFIVAADDANAASPVKPPAEISTAAPPVRDTSTGLHTEMKVVELITQIACEELRYPQRDLAISERRYRELAHALGFAAGDPATLQRTLRYYQSNVEFIRAHQQTIAENSLRCAMAKEQVSALP